MTSSKKKKEEEKKHLREKTRIAMPSMALKNKYLYLVAIQWSVIIISAVPASPLEPISISLYFRKVGRVCLTVL